MNVPNTTGALSSIVGGSNENIAAKVAARPKMEANPFMGGPGHEFSSAPYSMARKGMEPGTGIGGTTKKFDAFKSPLGTI